VIPPGCFGGPTAAEAFVFGGKWMPPDGIMDYRRAKESPHLVKDLRDAGFELVSGGKGSHRKFIHGNYPGAVTVSGKDGDDAKKYQEKQVKRAIEEVQE
jgi:predicted RNA binding protein YcfA (HicA-like mRNA interferase family)